MGEKLRLLATPGLEQEIWVLEKVSNSGSFHSVVPSPYYWHCVILKLQTTELSSIQCIEREEDKPFFVWSTGLYIFPAKTLIYQHLLLLEKKGKIHGSLSHFQWIQFTFSKLVLFRHQEVLFSNFYINQRLQEQVNRILSLDTCLSDFITVTSLSHSLENF